MNSPDPEHTALLREIHPDYDELTARDMSTLTNQDLRELAASPTTPPFLAQAILPEIARELLSRRITTADLTAHVRRLTAQPGRTTQ